MPKDVIVFLSGPITGKRLYRVRFWLMTQVLRLKGYRVLNPAILPKWLAHGDAMHICYGMIDVCDQVYFMPGWDRSVGCCMEYDYAQLKRKKIIGWPV